MPDHIVSVGDIELSVTSEGSGPPVVFLHGFPELAFSWRHQMGPVADAGFTAIAFDQRGYGASSKPADVGAYGLDALAGDVIGLLDALSLDTATVIGHDWGSIVAWSVAVMHPDRLNGLVSLNVPYRGWCSCFPPTAYIREHLQDRFGYVLRFQEEGRSEQAFAADPRAWLERVYRSIAGAWPFTETEFAVYVETFASHGVEGPLNYYRNIDANHALVAPVANAPITVPTMMMVPDADPVLPASLSEGMERWVADLRTVHIADSGHWTQQEQPEAVNTHLIAFLNELRASGSV